MSIVISLLGGSGVGKSTLAAGLFHEMKSKGYNVELVQEYVKSWAWEGKPITQLDQPFIFGNQSQMEKRLYHKVDYIITDSPLILSPIYEEFYNEHSIILPSVLNFLDEAKKLGVHHEYFVFKRNKPFNTAGRYEDAPTATKFDKYLVDKLNSLKWNYHYLNCSEEERIDAVTSIFEL